MIVLKDTATHIFIDTGILGLLANSNKKGVYVLTSDICDYEVRRNLILESLRKPNVNSVNSLDELKDLINCLPIRNEVMMKAANHWAEARIQGLPTADDKSLDADIIICAQYKILEQEYPGRHVVIAICTKAYL